MNFTNRRVRADTLQDALQSLDALRPSDGEVHYLWHFIQGSIMIPETRRRLRRGWGMCARHSFGALTVEAAFRHRFFHGPAILYDDLLDRATAAFKDSAGPLQGIRVARRLRAAGPCLMCELGYGPDSVTTWSYDHVRPGQDMSEIGAFARETEAYWRPAVCGRCAGTNAGPRCRIHLVEDLMRGAVDLTRAQALIQYLAQHMQRYARSFIWDYRGTDTAEDRAALIGAVGWCSGWQSWLVLLGQSTLEKSEIEGRLQWPESQPAGGQPGLHSNGDGSQSM